ncbi:leucyl aminopeptidase [Pseudoteredinibacter isoporae]|uniref:leucyl aminopeptidase n=1 Tax=Pseudoteredinibacter isoporae TaxID=570281 RepID=UPI00310C05EC
MINFQTKTAQASAVSTDCAIVAVYEKSKLGSAAKVLDESGAISAVCALGDFTGKLGQTQVMAGEGKAKRIVLLGLGKAKELTAKSFGTACQKAFAAIAGSNCKDASLFLDDGNAVDLETQARFAVERMNAKSYRFDELKSDKKSPSKLKKITLVIADRKAQNGVKKSAEVGAAIAKGVSLAKDLANRPGNVCTPTHLTDNAKRLAKEYKNMSAKALSAKQAEKLGMGSYLSVAAGSDEPSQFIIMEYNGGAKSAKPIVLVGKGITFDTGGISLKPGAAMDEMKFDMGGAAAVFGAMQSLLELALPINVVALVPATENMPNGHATKPGDVVTSMSGQTIEVLNTDAEGRLILCDALTYAERYKPKAVVDVATLTGACVVALGKHATAVYSNKDELADKLLDAGKQAEDKAWHMPLWDEYQSQLDSNFADMANIGGMPGGSITAACFLSRFAKKYDWAHLDIAGTAWLSGGAKGATGRPVSMLVQYLMNEAGRK